MIFQLLPTKLQLALALSLCLLATYVTFQQLPYRRGDVSLGVSLYAFSSSECHGSAVALFSFSDF
eukprot:738138-Hanusia_phi.AAC.1